MNGSLSDGRYFSSRLAPSLSLAACRRLFVFANCIYADPHVRDITAALLGRTRNRPFTFQRVTCETSHVAVFHACPRSVTQAPLRAERRSLGKWLRRTGVTLGGRSTQRDRVAQPRWLIASLCLRDATDRSA